ncbi:BRCA1-A complex subunit Abraxas 1 [Aplysia californica]|uniref:BRCA1-A complex subunit Abraxas 1 n=1 Tax=Aplysia californica TaxID=6500 RepID=A0ABM0JBB8_APLCA|nr:BRCA1-A complex subunit Abraxas 1 [Aplysia californica]
MSALIDGATLSGLLFSHMNSSGCQYGFLLGERVEQIEDRISDSQIHTADVNSYTYVSSFVPWPSPDYMYSRTGCLNEETIAKLLPDKEQTLVGWYSFRHQTSLRPSLREATLHSNLSSCQSFRGEPQDFYFFLCTSFIKPQGSTHICDHGFLHFLNGSFAKVPMSVMNLGDTTRTEYRKRSNATLSHSSTIGNTFQRHSKDFVQPTGEMDQVVKVDRLANSVNKSLMSMYTKVSQSEAALGLLEVDVRNLRTRVEMLEQEEMSRVFEEEDSRRKEAELKAQREDEELEAEEQSQLNKLMLDLGLTEPDQAAGWGQTASTSSSGQQRTLDCTPALDLSSYVQIDTGINEDSNSSPEIVCWSELPPICTEVKSSGGAGKEPVMKSEVQRTASKPTGSAKPSSVVVNDPLASLGDIGKLKKDLKLSDSKVKNGREQVGKQASAPSKSVSNLNHTSPGPAQVSNNVQNPNAKGIKLKDKMTVSKPTGASLSNGNADSEDSDTQMENVNSNNSLENPDVLFGVGNETIPSSSPLY